MKKQIKKAKIYINNNKYLNNKKYIYPIISFLLFIIIAMLTYFGIQKYSENKIIEQVTEVNTILNSNEYSKQNCEKILNFDKTEVVKYLEKNGNETNSIFNKKIFDDFNLICDKVFNISYIEDNFDNCKSLIGKQKTFFNEKYIILSEFENKRNLCISKYLNVKFSTGSFFDVENDFKSSINLDFSLDFYSDIGEEGSDEYISNRVEVKKRLKDLINIEPKVDFEIDDIYLYTKKAILNLPMQSLKKYTISLKNFDTLIGKTIEEQKFSLTTPENKYFGFKIMKKVSLFKDTNPPKFQLLEYNTPKTKSNIKICRIPNETYAKIEVFRKRGEKEDVKEFFKSGFDKLETYECHTKEIKLNPPIVSDLVRNKMGLDKTFKLHSTGFNFDELIGKPSRSGLYYVTFEDKEDREYNNRLNYPIFFGIIDSHITMKISRNGEAFFFVNDFNGNPLDKQNIRLYLNNFKEKEKKWNNKKRDYDVTLFSPLDKSVFDEPVILGKTGKDGILKVNLKEKIDNIFRKTFTNSWQYDYEGLYETFFVTSASETNLTYVNSTWNGGIAHWNFGYRTNDYWYGDNNEEDQDKVVLKRYGRIEPKYYSHIYTDRVLYLPGEKVNIKSVIRKSGDLSIPKNQDVVLKINDSKGKEILDKQLKISEYGSVSYSEDILDNAPLGNYNITLLLDGKQIGRSGFSVEVFKNPKFKNEVVLETEGLNNGLVKIEKEEVKKHSYLDEKIYNGNFKIKGKVLSKYYNGAAVKNADFKYKVYKQYYYESSYWDNCYYGCYWEPRKEFYTEGKGNIDEFGVGKFELSVDFTSNYSDYKYIVEVTVTDSAQDTISGSNSIIARLPNEYKKYNNDLTLEFKSDKKFEKIGNNILIEGGLNIGKWTSDYDNKYLFVIKKKEYSVKQVDDIRGYKRKITNINEKIEKILLVNKNNFTLTKEGKLEFKYKLEKTGEYVFEYGKIEEKIGNINEIDNAKLDSMLSEKKYFSVLTYGDMYVVNPIDNDNKIRVIPEKISYNLGEKARVLIRLPYENSKILWTIEKQGVVKSEYIDVKGTVFFKEFIVDDTFVPNAYIGVVLVDTRNDIIPEYKVGYSEIVVDKTEKKSFITINTDKKEYKPREKVTLDLKVKDKNFRGKKAELTVMVVDDSLISLMGNVDLNTLEKFYKKLPFQIQTSITSIAMLRNYYFSRPGIVGGSGFGNFKGGNSAVSTRNIFKNTAYYNPSIITGLYGDARVTFELPDNLTNFRVMVVSNSKENLFGYAEDFINVRKSVIVEDKTPIILRSNDETSIGANIFNNTEVDIGFKVELTATGVEINNPTKNITIKGGESSFVSWDIINNKNNDEIKYLISVLGNSSENSDKIEGVIKIKESPVLITNIIKSGIIGEKGVIDLEIDIPSNTDMEKSKVELIFSNNRLNGIQNIVSSLAYYPYGCIEQTTSSTLPNAILKKFTKLFAGIIKDNKEIDNNLEAGIARIAGMQTSDGGFAYWPGSSNSHLHITPYIVRSLIEMRESNVKIPEGLIEKAVNYLIKNKDNKSISDLEKAEIFWALAKAGKKIKIKLNLGKADRHTLLAYTYGLVLNNEKGTNNIFINNNIEEIRKLLDNSESSSWYRNELSDKAIFTSMLIDYSTGEDNNYIEYIDELIIELYNRDWSSYYYSTQAKNNAFLAFAKYIEKYSKNNYNKFGYTIGSIIGRKAIELGKKEPNIFTKEYELSDVIMDNKVNIRAANMLFGNIYVDVILKQYPKNKLLVKEYSNKMTVKKEIYEVLDEEKLSRCSGNNNYYYNKKYYSDEFSKNKYCENILKVLNNDIYKKGQLYKAIITVNLDKSGGNNLTVEDYLPASFKVINSKFKTEQISVKQNTTKSWRWDHIEFRPSVVMLNSSNIRGKKAVYEYFFRPEFEGIFTNPPVTSYMMYNPMIRANSEFRIIKVK